MWDNKDINIHTVGDSVGEEREKRTEKYIWRNNGPKSSNYIKDTNLHIQEIQKENSESNYSFAFDPQ